LKILAKLKRLATPFDDVLNITEPVSSDELLDRHLSYPILSPRHFAQRYNKLYEPVEFSFKGKAYKIQLNYCANPYCLWFGQPQERFEHIKNKPSRYKLTSKGRNRTDSIVCNPNHESHPDKKSLKCTITPISNWSVAEEIKRLATMDIVKDIEPDYVFHNGDCVNGGYTPFSNSKDFYRRGTSSGGSQKWQCKECKKITNVLPNREKKFTYNQKKNDIMPMFAKMLINRLPVSRTCEALNISPKTYYHKLEWLYRRCLEFLERYEQKPLETMEIDSLWLNTDKMIYNLNNVRRKGHGGLRYDNVEDKLMQTQIIVSGDVDTGYIFRSDVAYDWNITLEDIKEDTVYYKEDHLYEFSRKNGRLRFSFLPQPPTEKDDETDLEYEMALNDFQRRNKYIDGLHTNSNYTAIAHLWLLKQTLLSSKWRFVTDEDETLMKSIYRVFNEEILSGEAHHFLCKIDREKSLQDAFREHVVAASKLKAWGEANGFEEHSLKKLATTKVSIELNKSPLYKILSDGTQNYMVWAKSPIEHPLPPSDKGHFSVDCTTDISSYSDEYVANMLLKVTDRPTSNFMQVIRRRLSVLERPLVTARGSGKSYIYANFNPKYAQMAVTILRTYYNFCLRTKSKGKKARLTPAQQLGLTDKQFKLNDVIYFK
jgi:transposase-like protein